MSNRASLRSRSGLRVRLLGGCALAAGLMLTFGSPRPLAAQAAAQEEGKKVYNRICASCHQASGEGVDGVFPPLANSDWVSGDKGRLVRVILHGLTGPITVAGESYSGMMPPWGGAMKDAEIAAVSTYLRSTWGNKGGPVTTAEVTSIRAATKARTTPWTAKELVAATVKEK